MRKHKQTKRFTCKCRTVGKPSFLNRRNKLVAFCPVCKGDIAEVALHERARVKQFAYPGPTWDMWASWVLKEALEATRHDWDEIPLPTSSRRRISDDRNGVPQ